MRIDATTVAWRLRLLDMNPAVGASESNEHGLEREHIETVAFFQPGEAIQRNGCHWR
jgi:predicted DCC family thiol-disulfide oxidoreductase YuxK